MAGSTALLRHQHPAPPEGRLPLQGPIFRVMPEDIAWHRFLSEITPLPRQPEGGLTLRRGAVFDQELMLSTP